MKIIKQKLTEELIEFLNKNSIEDLADKMVKRFDVDMIDDFIEWDMLEGEGRQYV